MRGGGFCANEIFPVNVAYNVTLCVREYGKIKNYDRTSAGFTYHARRTAAADKREIYVYVIGEASRAANWELYGYDRPTNPCLKAKGDRIVVFRNMLTQSNTTHKSVPMILSSVRTDEHDELFRRKGLPALFNEAGFRTWFLSNQSPQGAMIDNLARDADSLIYLSDPRYDMQLLDTMKRIVEADATSDLLFILHCYGSHFSYHQRYPREAAHFLPDDDVAIERQHKRKLWNAYDNSIRYTDMFLSSTIDYLASLDACCALLYSSDHGEDMLRRPIGSGSCMPRRRPPAGNCTSPRWRGSRMTTNAIFPNRPPRLPVMPTLRRRPMRCSRPSPTLRASRATTSIAKRRSPARSTIRRPAAAISTITTAPFRSVRRASTGRTWTISAGGASNCDRKPACMPQHGGVRTCGCK